MIIPNWMESHKVMFQTTNQYWIMLSWSLYIAPNREYVRIQYGIAVMAGLTTLRHVYGHFKVRPIGTQEANFGEKWSDVPSGKLT